MELALSREQLELQTMLRSAFEDKLPSSRLRAALQGDAELWHLTASQLGLHGLAVPEVNGGSGAGAAEQLLLFEEAGRALVPGPFFSTVALAGNLVLAAGPAAEGHVTALADGSLRAAFAWYAGDEPLRPAVTAEQSSDGWVVSGTATAVLDGADADLLLVVADGPRLLAVPRGDAVSAEPLVTLDLTRPAATVRFDRSPATMLADAESATAVVRDGVLRATQALAAEQVGGAQRCLDLAVDYAKVREQFGRQIGSFQAVKHKLADMLLRVELARSLAWWAAWHPDDETWTAAAASACAEAYLSVATDCIQVHGGIGFTWEHDAHLHFRRARADLAMLGAPRAHRARLAELIA